MSRYLLTTEHAASSYGQPVLVERDTGHAYGVAEVLPNGTPAVKLYRALMGGLPEAEREALEPLVRQVELQQRSRPGQ